jgi:hypothetical protein
VAGPLPAGGARAAVADAPDRSLSRLVCPRLLQPDTAYWACVVPTYAAGRQAGLGEPVDPAAATQPAWTGAEGELRLPAYHAWSFRTGSGDDFATLARRLRGRPAPAGVGELTIDAWPADSAAPGPSQLLSTGGALRRPGAPAPAAAPASMRTRLAALVSTDPTAGDTPQLRLPLYGGAQAGATSVAAAATGWLAELNLDPRQRAAAALGARVVQERQDELVAAAWQQAGDALGAEQLVARAELAATANASLLAKHLAPLPADDFLAVTGPMHSRVRVEPTTVQGLVARSTLPDTLLSGEHRRVARPRGPVARRMAARAAQAREQVPDEDEGGVATARSAAATPVADALGSVLAALRPAPPSPDQGAGPAASRSVAVSEVQGSPEDVRALLLARLDPVARIAERVDDRITAAAAPAGARSGGGAPAGGLYRRLVSPRLDSPMYDALARLSLDAVVPGAELLPGESVSLLETNPTFVTAFLAGLNTEIVRELTWRGYPLEPTATCFHRFWDFRGHAADPGPDIGAMADWPPGSTLAGLATTPGGGQQLVLVVRGELLRRFPRTAVYAVRARLVGSGPGRQLADETVAGNVRAASFSGFVEPDIRFFGFDLTAAAARGGGADPGWFFVFQGQVTEARFGPADGVTLPTVGTRTSAELAGLLLRATPRVALPADALLPTGGTP